MAELLIRRRPEIDSSSPNADALERIGLALSDPTRRAVLIALLEGSRCPSDLADEIGTTRSNLSNHLACLRGCGLVRAERAGRQMHYELVSEQLADLVRAIVALAAELPHCDDHLVPRRSSEGRR